MMDTVLCTDAESLTHPALIGLDGEDVEAQRWLRSFSDAHEARRFLCADRRVHEVWVGGSDDIDPINLAAALKKDSCGDSVFLLAFDGSGSLKSRAAAAGLDGVLDRRDFASRYAFSKRSHARDGIVVPTMDTPSPEAARASAENFSEADGIVATRRPASSRSRLAPLLTVASASGGSGKSTTAALCAMIAHSKGANTLLIDADLQFGDERFLLGIDDPVTIDAAISNPSLLQRLKPDASSPALLAAPSLMERAEMVESELPRMVEHLRHRFDAVIVNTGAAWGDCHIQMMETSTNTVFLVDQRPSSLRACRHALDLCARCGVAVTPFIFALNRCSRSGLFSSIDVSCALQGARVVELAEGGRDVGELLAVGQGRELVEGGNAFCKSLESLVGETLLEPIGCSPAPSAKPSAKRLFPIFGRRSTACL